MARPSDLPTGDEEAVEMGVLPPVPGGDRDPDLEVRSGRGRSSSRAVEDRPRSSQGTSVERKRPLKFATPASWNGSTGSGKGRAVKEGLRTEGRMPVDEGDHLQGAEGLLREEAKKIAKRASESTGGRAQDDLERAMEKEVFMQFQDENMRLREELTKMQHMQVESGQQSVWSAVSEPPKREVDDELRFTPNGTRVPDGPPPMDLTEKAEMIPPWPLGSYEKVEMTGPCSNVFSGYVQGLPRQKGTLYDEDPGRGSGTRHVLPDGGSSNCNLDILEKFGLSTCNLDILAKFGLSIFNRDFGKEIGLSNGIKIKEFQVEQEDIRISQNFKQEIYHLSFLAIGLK